MSISGASMHLARTTLLVVSGMVAGIALVLSCGDDATRPVDAADPPKCDCPAAEPPLAERIVQVENTQTIPAMGEDTQGVGCPSGAIVLSGGCANLVGQTSQILVEESFPGDTSWQCGWRNPSNTPIQVRVIARCLKPTP
jgi:hypothetical protein